MNSTKAKLRPRLAVRVGVTGHRALTISPVEELTSSIRRVLELIGQTACEIVDDAASGYSQETPLLRVVSSLAEGSDRLVAKTATDLGWELQCPLPFGREDYRSDFSSESSQAEFDEFLDSGKTTAVVELDGTRADGPAAYLSAGRFMLDQCDLLIAIWDGEEVRGRGGTQQIINEAVNQEVPTVWIHSEPPHETALMVCMDGRRGCVLDRKETELRLPEILSELFAQNLDQAENDGHRTAGHTPDSPLDDGELVTPIRGSVLGWLWGLFFQIWGLGSGKRSAPTLPAGPFRELFDRADTAALHYSSLYRGSFLANYLLGVCAVLAALLAYAHPRWHTFWILVELSAICLILVLITVSKKMRWHSKAIDLRYLAEQLRQMLYLHPIGWVTPSSRPPTHYAYGDPRSTWMNWRFRAAVREIGMPGPRACLDKATIKEACARIRHQWLIPQADYHEDVARSHHAVDHRMHMTAGAFFFGTLASCTGHLIIHNPAIVPWLTFFSAGLPACGAALHAISSQGEFRVLSKRSKAMALKLTATVDSLDTLAERREGVSRTDLGRLTSDAARAMMDEVSDWRTFYRKPPLEPA